MEELKQADNLVLAPAAERPKPSILRRVGAAVDYGLMSFFGAIAGFVAQRPIAVLVACTAAGCLCAAGIVRINVVTNAEDLYTPQGNQAFKDRDYVEALYGYGTVDVKIYTVSAGLSNQTVLTKEAVLALQDLYDTLLGVRGTYKGQQYALQDPSVCYRPGATPGSPCDVLSVLDYWGYNRTSLANDPNILATINNPNATTVLGDALVPESVMGEISRDPATGRIVAAKALLMTLSLQNNKGGSGSSKVDHVTEAWQKAAVPAVRSFKSASVQFYILSPWQEDDISSSAITGDITLLIAGYALLLVYGLIVLLKFHPVQSRTSLTLANIASVALAVIASIGLCSLFGVAFSLVTQVLALLLLGLGTDDMLVTMAAHEETGREMPEATVLERVVATVSRARRGVIVAALTNFVAFCTGISSELPALRDFMVYAAVGVVLVLVFQSLFFVACLTFDVRRQQANRCDILCCRVSKAGPTDGCCGVRDYDGDRPSIAQLLIGQWLPKIILHPLGKIAVGLFTVLLLVMGAIGASRVSENFDIDWFVPSGTYVASVYSVRNSYFAVQSGKGAIPVGAYTKNIATPPLNYFDHQQDLANLATKLKSNPYVAKSPPVDSWYTAYLTWLPSSAYAGNLTATGRPADSAAFHSALHAFLDSAEGQRFKLDVIFSNTSRDVIISSRITFYTTNLKDSPQQVSAMDSIRATVAGAAQSLDAVAYAFPFLFFEGYAVIQPDTILAVCVAAAVVFVIMLLLLADFTASILVGCMVVLVDVELIGFIHWAGLAFNSVTSINLLLAIGIAVDYSAFIAFAFMTKVGTRQERTRKALEQLGVAVFNGGFTMFLAVLPVAFASSYIFQTFFKMFSMIVALGLWHGLFTLPVLLSLFGSHPYDSAYDREEASIAAAVTVAAPLGDVEAAPKHIAPSQQSMQ